MNFFDELKRRRVIRVVAAYIVVAWAAIQASDTIAPRLGLPDWTTTLIILIAAVSLPVVVVVAWIFDLGPSGIQRTEPAASATKSPARFVALAAVVVFAGLGALFGWRHYADASGTLDSIAVLPFVNMSGDATQEPFADGISEEILNALAQVDGLSVAARTSAFAFKKTSTDIREVARKLGVASVLEGSVQKQGDRLRITAQLINAGNGYHLWSETFDRSARDIFAVQDEIARAIVDALKIKLTSKAQPQVSRGGTANLSAHELYLLGLHHFARRAGPDMRRAIEVFSQAIAQDTSYALAYAGLAQVYAAASFYTDIPLQESARLGRAAAMKALALDSTVAEAYGALGDIMYHADWDLAGSMRMHRRALALKPSYAQAWDWLAEPLFASGQLSEALAASRRVLELDPLGLRANSTYAFQLYQDGKYDAAYDQVQRTLQIDSTNRVVLLYLIDVQLLRRQMQDAAAALHRFAAPVGEAAAPIDLAARALLDPALRPAALDALDHLEPGAWIYTKRLIAHLYLELGDKERALRYLERMYDSHDGSMMFVIYDINLAALRGEPRFQALARKLGIKPPAPPS